MGKIKTRILAVVMLALVLLTAISVSSCSKKLTKEEATAYVKEFVDKSYEINVIIFGEGLEHLDEQDLQNPLYSPVVENDKYNSISDIKLAIREIYSKDYAASLENTAFKGVESGVDGETLYPRYMENSAGELLILTDYTSLDYTSEIYGKYHGIEVRKYDTSTVEIEKINRRFVTAYVTSEDGKERIRVTLTREEDSEGNYIWKLHSSTC